MCRRNEQAFEASDVTPELLDYVLHRWPSIQNVCIAGFGEPLMSPLLPDVVKYLRAQPQIRYINLITNGALITKRMQDVFCYHFDYVNVSLNAADPEEHLQTTGAGTWHDVVAGVRLLSERAFPFNVGCSFVVAKKQVCVIPSYIEMAHEIGARWVTLHAILPHLGEDLHRLVALTTDDLDELAMIALWQHRAEDPLLVKASKYSTYVNHWPQPIDDKPPGKCRSPYVSIGVDGAGAYTPCRRVHGPDVDWFGSVDDTDDAIAETYERCKASIRGEGNFIPECHRCFGNWRE